MCPQTPGGLFLPRFRVKTGLPVVPSIAGRAMCTKIQSKDRPTTGYQHAESSDFTCIIYADLLPLYRVSYMFIHRLPTSRKSSTTAPSQPSPNTHPTQIRTPTPISIRFTKGEMVGRLRGLSGLGNTGGHLCKGRGRS